VVIDRRGKTRKKDRKSQESESAGANRLGGVWSREKSGDGIAPETALQRDGRKFEENWGKKSEGKVFSNDARHTIHKRKGPIRAEGTPLSHLGKQNEKGSLQKRRTTVIKKKR